MSKLNEILKNIDRKEVPTFLQEDAQRRQRWAYLTEGLPRKKRLKTEVLLDNVAGWLQEATTSQNIGSFDTAVFPLVRRVFPNLMADELVSVQPMSRPTGLVFFLDYVYGDDFAELTGHEDFNQDNAVTGGDTRLDQTFNRFYSGGMLRDYPVAEGDGSETDFEFPIGEYLVEDSEVVKVDNETVTDYSTSDLYAGDGLNFDSAPDDGAVITISAKVSPDEGEEPRELELDFQKESVEAETKKNVGKWTIETQQDLSAYHGLDADSEVLTVQSNQITREIDEVILMDLLNMASAGNVNFDWGDASTREEKVELYDAIIDANNLIYKKRYRNATWIAADPEACSKIEKLSGFKDLVREDWAGDSGMGVERFGILNNRFRVYKVPMFPENTMLLGHKGDSMFETGYVFAPYIPLYTGPVIYNTKMQPARAIMSRYARKPLITDLYATVRISD